MLQADRLQFDRVANSFLMGILCFVAAYRLLEPGCRHRLLGARLRRDLLRRRAGLQTRRFSSGIVELPVNLLASFPELIHALPQAPRQVRQLFRPEENKNDEEDDK